MRDGLTCTRLFNNHHPAPPSPWLNANDMVMGKAQLGKLWILRESPWLLGIATAEHSAATTASSDSQM